MAELSEQVERVAVKLPQAALDAWVEYDLPEFKYEMHRIRDAFMAGYLAALQHPVASSEAQRLREAAFELLQLCDRADFPASYDKLLTLVAPTDADLPSSSEAPTADQQEDNDEDDFPEPLSREVHCGGCAMQMARAVWTCPCCERSAPDERLLDMPGGYRAISAREKKADQQDDWAKPLLAKDGNWSTPELYAAAPYRNPDGPAAVAKLRSVVEALKVAKAKLGAGYGDHSNEAIRQNNINEAWRILDRALRYLGRP